MNKAIFTNDVINKKIIVEKELNSQKNKVWEAWTDWKILEKWWWPKTWPATTKSFDFSEWGHWHYYMTWPDGTQVWWLEEYLKIFEKESILVRDYFSDENRNKNNTMPPNIWFINFLEEWNKTKVIVELRFEKLENMQQIIDMWFEDWFSEALENLEEYLKWE